MGRGLRELIAMEDQGLAIDSARGGGYSTHRNWLIDLISQIGYTPTRDTQLLEVGCGVGNSLIDICREWERIQTSNCIGTSLQPLPGHGRMRDYGIKVVTGIIAENLPSNREEQFDITMTCARLMHVDDLTQAVHELLRVTKPNGHILIYDLRPNIEKVEFMAKQQNHEVIKPRSTQRENLFGTIIHKQ